jgi:hypothetical protein
MARFSKYFQPARNKVKQIEYRADRDGIELNVSDEDLSILIKEPCHYCGNAPEFPNVHGVDRKDNNQGYIYGNCLPSCKTCNFMKNTLPYVTFLRMCKQITEHHS